MLELVSLVRIITFRSTKFTPLLELKRDNKEKNKEVEFFYKIKDGTIKDDDTAEKILYPEGKVGNKYKMLKSRLKTRLLNHLFFLDFEDDRFKVSDQYEQECLDHIHHVRTLMNVGEHRIAEKLLTKTYKIAKEAEFTYIIIQCLELQKQLYAETCKPKLYSSNLEELNKYRQIHTNEQEASDTYYALRLALVQSISSKKKNLPKVEKSIKELYTLWRKSKSFNTFEFYYLLNIWYLELTGDFKQIISIAENVEKEFKLGLINNKRFDLRYNKFIKVYAFLRNKDYATGLSHAKQYISSFHRESSNWFSFMENYFLLALHASEYELATSLLIKVSFNPNFSLLTSTTQARWNLYGGYLYFLRPQENLLKKFDFGDYLSNTPEFTKDKEGFNISVLILQFLVYLQKRDTDNLVYRVDCLRKYSDRYLTGKTSVRSKTFLKLLSLVVTTDFNPDQCRNKGKRHYERLVSAPIPGDAFAEIEIIPYENLWKIILNTLELNRDKKYAYLLN